jgi:hypothetical protein
MRLLARADDRIDRAGRQAFDTTNATVLVNYGDQRGTFNAIVRIQWQHVATKEICQRDNGRRAAGRALIDGGTIVGNRFRIRAAPVVATARALCLRKKSVDSIRERHGDGYRHPPSRAPIAATPVAKRLGTLGHRATWPCRAPVAATPALRVSATTLN